MMIGSFCIHIIPLLQGGGSSTCISMLWGTSHIRRRGVGNDVGRCIIVIVCPGMIRRPLSLPGVIFKKDPTLEFLDIRGYYLS